MADLLRLPVQYLKSPVGSLFANPPPVPSDTRSAREKLLDVTNRLRIAARHTDLQHSVSGNQARVQETRQKAKEVLRGDLSFLLPSFAKSAGKVSAIEEAEQLLQTSHGAAEQSRIALAEFLAAHPDPPSYGAEVIAEFRQGIRDVLLDELERLASRAKAAEAELVLTRAGISGLKKYFIEERDGSGVSLCDRAGGIDNTHQSLQVQQRRQKRLNHLYDVTKSLWHSLAKRLEADPNAQAGFPIFEEEDL
jgi:hypothetical protein